MKQKLLSFILLLSVGITSSYAYDFSAVASTGQTLYYYITSRGSSPEVSVTSPGHGNWYDYTYPIGSLTIPSTVTYGSTTYSVTTIGNYAFYYCSGLTSVTIPNSVTSIGERAFSGCSGLTSLTIGNSVTSIGSGAFSGCSGLTSVAIPNSVTSIGSSAFSGCSGLTSLTIPNSVTTIGDWAFLGCSGLTSLTIPNSVTSIGNFAFSNCSGLTTAVYNSSFFAFLPITYSGNYSIPTGITTICGGAFSSCSGLASLTIPNSVTSIGDFAFTGCSGLTSITVSSGNTVYDSRNNCNAIIETATNTLIAGCQNTTIPNSVTTIGNDAFYDCSGLTSLTIPNSVTTIGNDAFYDCSGLTSLTIGNSVTTIGDDAFSGCSGLTSLTIGNSVTSIGEYAFSGCSSLTSVTIPNSVTSIENWAFSYCTGLTSITVSSGNTVYDSRNNCNAIIVTATNTLIAGCQNTTIPNSVTSIGDNAFEGCRGLTSLTISNSVTSIGGSAFSFCSGLTSLTIGNSVNSIWYGAFYGCSGLTSITAKCAVAPSLASYYVFSDVPNTIPVYIPCGSYASYSSTWGYFSNFIEVPFSISVSSADSIMGSATIVTHPTCSSSTATVSATPNAGYIFTNWTEKGTVVSTDATYTFSVTADRTLTAHFASAVPCSIAATDLPYTDNFDSYTTTTTAKTGVQPDCWTLAHQEVAMADEYKPMIYYSSANAHSGNYSLLINKRGIYAMPEFDGDVSTLQLSMYLKQGMAKYQLQVGVMSDLSDVSTFVPVATLNNSSTGVEHVTLSFAPYTGTGRYIAFRNILAAGNSGDFSCNYIDDLVLDLRPVNTCTGITVDDLPYIDNFDTYTTSTTAKTGVAPDCWTLAYQEVAMTDEYKPMIYYNTSNAHSGSYSLILNKRCLYAMPAYDGDVSALQMSFYLKQTNTSYGLTVGVMSNLSDPGTFVPVASFKNPSTANHEYIVVDFSSYTGNGHYIAFRNTNTAISNFSCNYIDDLTLDLRPSNCGLTVDDLPYTDKFDSYTTSTTAKTGVAPDCWTLAYQEVAMTDEYKPMIYYNSSNAHSGNYSLILNKRCLYAMPAYDGDVSTLQLSFYLKQTSTNYGLTVGVMSDLEDPSTFVPVASFNNPSTANHEYVVVDFSSYTGDGHYIAFRNTNTAISTFSCNYIDDLTLVLRSGGCGITVADLPYTDNFDSYTTSTIAKTGVAPDCWTLAHQDVVMTDEYKPMIYYNASCAHSSSLMLNKRGIYAMPAYEGDVRDLQLSFYVRQTQAKYQLQVGVMTDLSNVSTFVPVATFNNTSTTTSVLRTVNFASYTGNGHHIAFRNILAAGQTGDYNCNYIDDLTLSMAGAKSAMHDDNHDVAVHHEMNVYPNPTTGMLTVEADEEVERVEVYDYTGRSVATFERQATIDLSRLSTGIYTLRVTLPERIEVRRVVKQ